MNVGEVCKRQVVVAERGLALVEAARRMRENHVGCLVVVDDPARPRPVGILTDRDIVVEVVAADLTLADVTVGDIMSGALETVHEGDGALGSLATMRRRGVRRLPVTDAEGFLVGIVTLDDLLEVLAGALQDAIGAVDSERMLEGFHRQ